MTAKEKAEELVNRFRPYADWNGFHLQRELLNAKQCALIAVDEILDSYQKETKHGYIISDKIVPYWQEVKNHIQEL